MVTPPTGTYLVFAIRAFTARINSSMPRSTDMDITSYTFNFRRMDLLLAAFERMLIGGADGTNRSGGVKGGADAMGISGVKGGADAMGISGVKGGADAMGIS